MNYLKNVSTVRIDSEKCSGCGVCVEVCPRGVLVMNDRKASIAERDACMECGACQRNCAFNALTVNAGVGCAQALINAMITGGEPVCGCSGEEKNGTGCC
jgi:NAD-dependent dihydropyrimidine dehydrogenase PreA subunit